MKYRDILEEIFMTTLGDSVPPEKIGELTAKVMQIGKIRGVEIIHQIGPNGFHRLVVDGVKTEWHDPSSLIRHGQFVAATDAFINLLPQLSKIFALDPQKDFKTEAIQSLAL